MLKTRLAAVALATAALAVGSVTPAHAANSPQVRSTGSTTTFSAELASLDVRYRCAPGTASNIHIDLWQGTSKADATSHYVGDSGFNEVTCDGKKHTITVITRIRDWDPEYGSANYNLFTAKADGGARAHAEVTLTDHLGAAIDVDHDRVAPVWGPVSF